MNEHTHESWNTQQDMELASLYGDTTDSMEKITKLEEAVGKLKVKVVFISGGKETLVAETGLPLLSKLHHLEKAFLSRRGLYHLPNG